jgi:NTP pyrophosphatase (non-canonical NTP hydrolase)
VSDFKTLTGPIQAVCDLYAERCDIRRDDDWFLLKIQEELGELVQAHLKLTGRGRTMGVGETELTTARADEAADLLCMVLLYCRRFDIDLDEDIQRKWLSWLDKAA